MKLRKTPATGKAATGSFWRRAGDIFSNPALARYTPAGPSSLATGQAAHARHGRARLVRNDAGKRPQQMGHAHPTWFEFALPLKQVFWI